LAQGLARYGEYDPQAAFAALTHTIIAKWVYLQRVTPEASHLFQPLEDYLRHHLLPILTGRPNLSDLERAVFALPSRDGGVGVPNPVETSSPNHLHSIQSSRGLAELIWAQAPSVSLEHLNLWRAQKADLHKKRKKSSDELRDRLLSHLADLPPDASSIPPSYS
jgi:hypothetical protein